MMVALVLALPCRLPLYGELKALLLAWLVLPHTKGASWPLLLPSNCIAMHQLLTWEHVHRVIAGG